MLCPMCGEPTAEGDRWLQTAHRRSVGALRGRGLGAALPSDLLDARVVIDAGSIAPCHLTCARRAADNCPHLQAHTSGELIAFPETWVVLPLMVKAEASAGANVLARPPSPVAHVSQGRRRNERAPGHQPRRQDGDGHEE